MIGKIRQLTVEEKKLLLPFLPNMETAYSFGFTRSINRKKRAELYDIYNSIAEKKRPVNTGCTSCVTDMLKELYPFFNYKEPRKKKEVKNDNTE